MAGLENLFATEASMPNTQTTKMPENADKWPEMFTTLVREFHPDAAKLPITVEFKKRDDESGTAIGAVNVSSVDGKKLIHIPFIVKKFQLHPLDVWMESKTQAVHPLSKDTFKEVFFSQSMDDGLDVRPGDAVGQYFNDPSLWTTNYPPLQGRYSYASAGYPILDQISDTLGAEDLKAFCDALEASPMSVAQFKKHGHIELISKLAAKAKVVKAVPNSNNFVASAMSLIPVTAMSVKKEGPDKYSILSATEGVYDIAGSVPLSREETGKAVSKITSDVENVMHDVDKEGEKLLTHKQPKNGVWLHDDFADKAEDAKEFAAYAVKNKAGMEIVGVVVPKVVDFAGNKKPLKLFLSAGHCSAQADIAGIKLPNSDVAQKLLKPRDLHVGQSGSFVYIDDGKAIATIPVTISAVEGSMHSTHGPFSVVDMNGNKFKVSRGYGEYFELRQDGVMPDKAPNRKFLDAHGMIEVRPKEYIIPQKMMWVPMEGHTDIVSTPSEWLQKTAFDRMSADPAVIRWTGVVYECQGGCLEKRAYSERELRLALAAQGATIDKLAMIIKKAKAIGRAKVHGRTNLKHRSDLEKEAATAYQTLQKLASGLKATLVKQAAEIEDSSTVDTLLALNFLNPENMAKFVSFLPVLVKAADHLAELAVACRLGLSSVNESSVVSSMHKLQDIINGLKGVEISMKRPATKTAAIAPKQKQKLLDVKKRLAVLGG